MMCMHVISLIQGNKTDDCRLDHVYKTDLTAHKKLNHKQIKCVECMHLSAHPKKTSADH